MDRKTAIAIAVSLALAGASAAGLPRAAFDRGGTTFDLRALSAARFPMTAGGRRKASG